MKLGRLVIAVLLVGVLPAAGEAQRRGQQRDRFVQSYENRFSLEPYAGAFKDAFDISDANTGYLVGLRVGYDLGWRGRLQLNAGYSEVDDVALEIPSADYYLYDNNWIFTTIGGEFDVIPGRTSASLGLQAGAAWRKVTVDGAIGNPLPSTNQSDDGYTAYEVLAPGLTFRHRLTPRAALSLTLEDYIFDLFEGPVDHSPAVSLGFSFR
jgi:hypothetical protein